MVVGEALQNVMNKQGIPVVKVNYQDMGNWAAKSGKQSYLHYHIMGRAKNAVKQPWPESVYLPDRGTGFYDDFQPLNEDDVKKIKEEIEKIFKRDKYQDKNWHLDSV
jgi:diadenosine tetraphosphate (Ap4A) HIT family hydrolase